MTITGSGTAPGAGRTGAAFAVPAGRPHSHRWWVLATVAIAQLMVVLDNTIVNIALPSAQRDLGFSDDSRQWIITAYALAFGSLLLLGGRLSDLFGRKTAFMTGLVGFALASAVGGAAGNFAVLVSSRAAQGVFGALLAPSALALLTTTFTDGRERGKAFGIFGAIAGGGAAIGLLLGGILTQYLSWRWCLYVNLAFAVVALVGAAMLLPRGPAHHERPRLDLPGTLAVSGALFCLVFGLSHAETDSWSSPLTWEFLVVAVPLLAVFVYLQARVAHPLLPLRVVLDRNRGGAFLAILLLGVGMFGIFLFLTYFMQRNLAFSPVRTGFAFLPMVAGIMTSATTATTVLLPRVGPKPLVPVGLAAAGGAMFWLSFLTVDSTYARNVLPPLILGGLGVGLAMAPSINTATRGVLTADAGVASATVSALQQIGGSVGTALLSSIAGTATANELAGRRPTPAVVAHAAVHGFTTAFVWGAAIFVAGALVCVFVLRAGPPTPVVVQEPTRQVPGQDARSLIATAVALVALALHIQRAGSRSPHLIRAAARLAPHGGATDVERARTAARDVLRPLAARTLMTALAAVDGGSAPVPPSGIVGSPNGRARGAEPVEAAFALGH